MMSREARLVVRCVAFATTLATLHRYVLVADSFAPTGRYNYRHRGFTSSSSSFVTTSPRTTVSTGSGSSSSSGTRLNIKFGFGRSDEKANGEDFGGGGVATSVLVESPQSMITPEGYGFTSPMSRILKDARRGGGFYRAKAGETVIDVMEAITSMDRDGVVCPDVALVFDEDDPTKLMGLFTETDYIKVSSRSRQKVR